MSDIQVKYQKLAAEYSKLRAQLPVLKKAVLDEQAKTEQLQETVKEKDQSVRKYEQELESLMFRNQQLSSRVAVLQQELDESEAKSKKNKKQPQFHGVDANTHYPEFMSHSSVIGEELQNKIEENERLHKQVHEASLQYEQTVGQLQEKLMLLEAEMSHHQEALTTATETSRSQINKLQEDKAVLEAKLQKQEKEAKELLGRALEAESNLHTVQEDLSSRLEEAESIIRSKLAFNDSENKQLNSLNIPAHNRVEQLQIREMVGQAARLIKELVQGLSNYYTYSEQRSKVYPIDADVGTLSDVNKKYCHYLHENTFYLRPIEQTFSAFHESLKDDVLVTLETANGLTEFAAAFKKYVSYASKLLPYQLLSLDEESSESSCTSSLESNNKELTEDLKSFVASLSKLETYICIITTQSDIFNNHPRSSHFKMFQVLTSTVSEFHDATSELCQRYAAKASLENQLPTITQRLRVTGECIVSTLNNLVTCTSKISAFMAGNLACIKKMLDSRMTDLSSIQSEHIHPYVNTYRQRAARYMSMIVRKVGDLKQKVRLLEAKMSGSIEDNLENVSMATRPDPIGSVTKPMCNPSTVTDKSMCISTGETDCDNREQLIRQHFSNRINELTLELQTADSKGLYFHAECRASHKQLKLCQQDNELLRQELNDTRQSQAQLKDELQTTTRSYEGQLSMMSEHLAAINEKLTTQKDEIDVLKYQLNNCNKTNKKGKIK
ncbi:hypothetical protein LSH36_286g01011 [Paralvinella palmiformis]|uniref:Protein phosphatase 1 regulatory subunit 21 n=1 Tax=Paralvinella palmiformis TaxID=53620 RepID=A0AAD9JIS7_9ANNE|nr:hypothetical protein LSH36_286g01011 [Paralvinella palmiformis]